MYSGTSDAFGDYDEFSKDWSVDGRTALEHHLNGDVLPHLDNYHSQQTKNQLRPTLEELHLGQVSRSEKVTNVKRGTTKLTKTVIVTHFRDKWCIYK